MQFLFGMCCLLCCLLTAFPAFAASVEDRVRQLEEIVQSQSRIIKEQQEILDRLQQQQTASVPTPPAVTAPQAAVAAPPAPKAETAKASGGLFGSSFMSNPNISLVVDTNAYASSLSNSELANRSIPGFTTRGLENKNNFNLESAELFLFAPVDPYFNLYAAITANSESTTLEEAYAVTTSLPWGIQAKGGQFKSNFSRLDAQHPHAWDFTDIALPYRAFMGPEGLGGEKGAQLTLLAPLPFYLLLGGEVLQGDNDLLFGSDAASGAHAYSLFAKTSVDIGDSTLYGGPYALFGRTQNTNIIQTSSPGDTEAIGDSALYGLEAIWKWKFAPRRAFSVQGEYLYLSQNGNLSNLLAGTSDAYSRSQDGWYIQAVYQHDRWRFGARGDGLGLFFDRFGISSVNQNFGSTPWRVSAMAEYNPSEFTRIRLQYTHDESARNGQSNDEVYLQFIFGIGAHAAHSF